MDFIIKHGTVVNPNESRKADVHIRNGKIHHVGNVSDAHIADAEVIDASGRFVIPGGIDPHVHMQLPTPAGPSSDNFFTGSRAALFGGNTTIIDFVTPHRGQSLVDTLLERKEEAAKSIINVRLHVSPVEWRSTTEDEILACIHDHGIRSFKCYMAYKNNIGLDDDALFKVMKTVGKAGGIVLLHCEDGDAIDKLRSEYARSHIPGPLAHCKSRPAELEAKAVEKAIRLSEETGCPIYIVHVSSLLSLALIAEAKAKGQPVYAETCPQYLLLDDSVYQKDFEAAGAYVMSPPLRSKKDNAALWEALADGTLSTTGTDHCPFTLEQKLMGKSDFRKIPNGAGGTEHRMSLLYAHGVAAHKFSMNRFVEITSSNSAKIFGMYPQKGKIAAGSDADLVIWDPDATGTISAKSHHQNSDLNIYEGFKTRGAPEVVVLGGEVVMKAGRLT